MITQELILRTAVEKGYTIDKEGNGVITIDYNNNKIIK